jgi:hypothetical protein
MAELDFKAGFDDYIAAHQKTWKHDRKLSVGASEIFGCLRKAWFGKHDTPVDPNHKESWGAMERGNLIEEFHVEPAIRWYLENKFPDKGARLTMGGKRQRTLIDTVNKISATPDGLVVGADDDALAIYGIPSLGGSGCFNFEIKSIDPRVNLKEEKAVHRGQTIVQMGLTREQLMFKPNFAVILYVDASFLDDIDVFIVPFDQRTYDAAKERGVRVYEVKDPSEIMPEGKLDDSCKFCKYTHACARASREATPTDGEATSSNMPPALMAEIEKILIEERGLKKAAVDAEKAHKSIQEQLKEWLREIGVKRVEVGDIKATISWSKGRKSFNRKAAEEDGLNLSKYDQEGEGFDTLRVTEKGSTKADED